MNHHCHDCKNIRFKINFNCQFQVFVDGINIFFMVMVNFVNIFAVSMITHRPLH